MHQKTYLFVFMFIALLILLFGAYTPFPSPQTYHPTQEVSINQSNLLSSPQNKELEPDVASEQILIEEGRGTNDIIAVSQYPLHTDITATVFWVGEPKGGGSSENNALSAWDDKWQQHYGGYDDPLNRSNYYPADFTPKENPFYFDLPYDDFDWNNNDGRRVNAYESIPWAKEKKWAENESMLKNRWIKISHNGVTCYGQWEDAGPYVYDDARYVFGEHDERPKNTIANNAGIDVSPALRDCLKFQGLNNDTNKVDWQFVNIEDVPEGPWKKIITTSQTYWK